MDITKYIFRENGIILSEQTYNGVGGSDFQNYGITAPTPSTQQGFVHDWNLDEAHSGGEYILDDGPSRYEYTFYFDVIYIYNNSNYVTYNFLYDNGEFATVQLTNGNTTSNCIGFGAYYNGSIVSALFQPKAGYSITSVTPTYQGTWNQNRVYRINLVEGARIIWKDYDGSTIRTDYVREGQTPTPPTVIRNGYTHTGWTPQIVPVVGDATYTAQYTINYYDVRFFSDPGVLFDQARLAYGTELVIGTNPTKTDYTFVRWNPTPTTVTQDQDYYAVWEKTTFTINYYDEQTLLNTIKVNKGNTLPNYVPTKSGYRFDKWTPNIQSPVYADANYTATWNQLYTVIFYDSDGTSIISTNEYIIGEDIVIPTPPAKPHYIFIEWNPEVIKKCNGDATYTAVYAEYSTTIVKFYDYYGQVYSQQSIDIPGEFVMNDLTLDELVLIGVTVPILPDINNKSFLEWIKHPTKYDESNNTVIYSFWSRYIKTSLGTDYCDNQLDDLEDEMNKHDNNMNLHIDEQNNMINDADTTIGKLNNIDGDIIDELRIVEEGYNKNLQKILLLNNRKYDEQFSYLYSNIQEVQDEITYIGINHMEELYGIGQTLNTNESRMTNLQNKIYSIPKHYIISQNEYNNLVSKDKNAIYFTKEK
jgi:hypothetical protein